MQQHSETHHKLEAFEYSSKKRPWLLVAAASALFAMLIGLIFMG